MAGRVNIERKDVMDKRRVCCFCEKWESGGIESFLHNVIMEMDNVAMIKDLVALGLGVSVVARSASIQAARKGKLSIVPIENVSLIREVRMVYHKDFAHLEILEDLKRIYDSV